MANINLLPWREAHRQEKKKEFLSQLGAVAIIAAVGAFAWIKVMDNAIAAQQQRNNLLQTEINLLSEQVREIQELKKKRRELLDRMRVIQDLEGKRSIIVHYFDEFVKAIPDGVFVNTLSRNGDVFSIEGVSESNARISNFMRQLDQSEWFSDPNLKSVVASPEFGEQAGKFVMELKATLPEADKTEDASG